MRVVLVTLDRHLAAPVARAEARLRREIPGLKLSLHAATEWAENPAALEETKAAVAEGDIVVASMLFLEDHIQAILPALQARRDQCDAMLGLISAGEVVKLTRLGPFSFAGSDRGPLALLKRLRGKRPGQQGGSSGAGQMKMLRRLPKILRFIPGKAQDLRAYFLSMQYYLGGSEENIENMVRYLVGRYATGPRAALAGTPAAAPIDYPETGVYHPDLDGRVATRADALPRNGRKGRVGLLLMRSYILAGETAHYDGVIRALEAQGLSVVPAFAAGLDARPAVDAFFRRDGQTQIDALVSLTGFSLIGGPAYNDAPAAAEVLKGLDVPYLAAHALEFQRLEQWRRSDRGLMPIEATMMVAIPEIDGATSPTIFGGRAAGGEACQGCDRHCQIGGTAGEHAMLACAERCEVLAARVARQIALRRARRAERRVAIILYGFPPNAGAVGSAANLAVFESLFNTLGRLWREGYAVELPESVDALRAAILQGNAQTYGTPANVHARVSADEIVAGEPHLAEIEKQWGAAPGKAQSNGREVFVLGHRFGSVFVGVQPAFGYEGDPMRLLFEHGFAPTHAFAAFYRWIKERFQAHAVLHFGTHGALEFMPGKQTGLTDDCWPDRLIGDLPNLYLYAANNPSEATIAKRRSAATTISYLTPPLVSAGLYRGLLDLKASIQRWRGTTPDQAQERLMLEEMIQAQAAEVDLAEPAPLWNGHGEAEVHDLATRVQELEETLIPHGLHVIGKPANLEERTDLLAAMAEAQGIAATRPVLAEIAAGRTVLEAVTLAGQGPVADPKRLEPLARAARHLAEDSELPALVHALDGGFVPPVAGGDLVRTPEILPTGRNIHGFDPFRLPSAFALADGKRQADLLLARHTADGNPPPRTVALVLWGTDNLKTEGGPIAQALALIGAKPRWDSYGRLSGADLIPLAELGRPRIDVVMTLSGIFRDLLPLQTKLLAEAAYKAATAEEPVAENLVRAHALAYRAAKGCDMATAALRVFSNAEGAYGSNVNLMVENGAWGDEDELADTFQRRKCFAYGVDGKATQQADLLESTLREVDLAYQNLESVELGITTVDHYFDTLGGISRGVRRAKGAAAPVYIGDQTRGQAKVRTLSEQVALETRTRALNPKWYEGMLSHGHEGVRQIEAHVTNTVGWSATTGAVDPWVYQRLSETFVLDAEMRKRLAELNPTASARMASRLIEAHERRYWTPDAETLEALTRAGEELEDRMEGIA